MASPIVPVNSQPPMAPVSHPSSLDPTTAAGAVSSNVNAEQLTSNSTISSIDDLRKKDPAFYNKMMEGIAYSMINKMKRDSNRLKEIMREDRNRAMGG